MVQVVLRQEENQVACSHLGGSGNRKQSFGRPLAFPSCSFSLVQDSSPPGMVLSTFQGGSLWLNECFLETASQTHIEVCLTNGLWIFNIYLFICIGWAHRCVAVREQLSRVGSLLPRCGYHVLRLGDVCSSPLSHPTGPTQF